MSILTSKFSFLDQNRLNIWNSWDRRGITSHLSHNVCFIKILNKHNSNTLLCLLRIFMKQTLWTWYKYLIWKKVLTFHMVTVASMPTSLAPTEETSKRRYFFACLSARWHHMALAREITWVRTHVHHTYRAPWAGFSTGWASLKAGSVFVQMCHIQGCLNLFSLIWSIIHSWKEIW